MTATRTDPFAAEFARTIASALVVYGPTARLAIAVAEGELDDGQLDGLHLVGRHVGLELIGFLRAADLHAGELSPADDPAPVLELACLLGESLALLLLVTDADTARRLPLAPPERIDHAYGEAARAWLGRYLPDVPERTDEEDRGS